MSESIVFFGSGPVAAKSLELLAENFTIEAVITKPRPAHHKQAFPALVTAEKLGLKTFTPSNKQELSKLFARQSFTSKIGVVIDYGIIIAQEVIDAFPLGIINSHFSLLPRWRGADPISFAILNGDAETGVSLMRIVEALDEGPLLSLGIYALPDDITTPELTSHLIKLSDALLTDALPKYVAGEITPRPQVAVAQKLGRSTEPTYSRKLIKADGIIDWTKSAVAVDREIRAFVEWPKSRTQLAGHDVVITKAHPLAMDSREQPGKVEVNRSTKTLLIHCGEGYLCIDALKPAGKQEMTSRAFLAGYGKDL